MEPGIFFLLYMGTSWGSLVGRGSGGERFVSVDAELFLGKWYRYKHDSAHADKVNLSTIAGRHRERDDEVQQETVIKGWTTGNDIRLYPVIQVFLLGLGN